MKSFCSPCSWSGILIPALFGALTVASSPAAAQTCGSDSGYFISFTDQPGDSPAIPEDFCSDSFRCAKPQAPGGFVLKVDSGCDPEVGPCAVELRFPLEFRGNKENIDDVGLSGAPTPVVYWWDGAADTDCEPWFDSECGQVGICGFTFFKIAGDFTETWLRLGSASCANPVPTTHSGLFSIMAASCPSRFSCPKREFDSLNVTPAEVKKGLGCVQPPMEECTAGGAGPAGGPPGIGGPGSPATGPGATLRYTGGGAGFSGLPGSASWTVALGRGWSHEYAERIVPFPDESRVFLITRFGTFREWSALNGMTGVYETALPSSEKRTLTWLGAGLGWELTGLDGAVTLFDDTGLWLSTTDRNGNATVATYGGGALASVSFPDGRSEDFAYDASTGKLASIVEVGVDGITTRTWDYTWSEEGTGDDLTRIDRPDGTALLLTYGDAAHPGFPTLQELEGTDGTSVRVLRGWEYDAEGNVTRTWAGDSSPTGPDAVEVWSFAFDDPGEPTVTTVTDPLGQVITYTIGRDTLSTNTKVLSVSGDCPVCGLGPNVQLSYDDPQNPLLPTAIVDARGTVTSFTYDAFGQRLTRTETDGDAALQRTTTWTYDATFRSLVASMDQPSVAGGASTRTIDWSRNAQGNGTGRTISGVEGGSAFTLTTTTTFNAAGLPLTIDPPGHGTADETSFTYDASRGNLVADSRTDPLVGATILGHDPFNRRTSVTDPNGVTMTTTYDPLDRVTEVRQDGASPPTDDLVTAYTYTVFGDLLRTTLPRGNVLEYEYDSAGRLISVERKPDAATPGERVLHTLDAAGNRTLEELQRWDAGAGAWVTLGATAFEYSNRCQVDRIVQAPGSLEEAATAFEYDCNGNLTAQWDANHDPEADPPTMSYTYDALDRLTESSQPWASGGSTVTSYSYDVQDHLTAVTDAEDNTTAYAYSDRDLLTQQVSPVSGTTSHSYDEHGELVTTTDARGVTVTRTVDALDRLTFVDYPDDALDTTYTHDTEPVSCGGTSFEIGRLGAISRDGEAVEYCYDRFGRTTRDGQLAYTYDANGNRTGIGYPGNVAATYTHDFADREANLTVTSSGGTEPVVSAASYLPSGPLSSLALGSGVTETRAFDGRYAPAAIALTSPIERTFSYTTDGVGNVLEIVEQPGCTPGPLVLENQTITTVEAFLSCTTIESGNGFAVESPGDVAFHAEGTIALKSGFSVASGARFVAGSGGIPALSRRTFTYQAPQYFLTSADGPWGELDWSYDRIGNRLSETRDAGTPDTYQYLVNGTGGNTPVLDLVNLGVGGTRDYTWGAAGHLEEVAAGANLLDFGADAEGRLSGVDRTAATETAAFLYDGRSFLRSAQETAGGTASVEALYDSAGVVHALRRHASASDPEELVVFAYLAGRPVAQLAIDGAGAETWTYLATDHLGTPLLATDEVGAITWKGGLEPFGRDYQQGTPEGALESGIFLRFPGQWDDGTWADATSGAGVAYNVHRWLESQTGRYTRPDPAGLLFSNIDLYGYAARNPLRFIDPYGLMTCVVISAATIFEIGSYSYNFGDHSALLITGPCSGSCSSSAPLLYDPAGGFSQQFPGSGSAQTLTREVPGWDTEGFFDYHCNSGSDFLEVYCFDTTCCEEQAINEQIPGGMPGGACALGVGGAIQGIGPFSDVGGTPTPAVLRRAMNRLLQQHPNGGAGTFTHTCSQSRDR